MSESTRQHKKDQWALDDVISHTEVLAVDMERIRDVPDEGQNVSWNCSGYIEYHGGDLL